MKKVTTILVFLVYVVTLIHAQEQSIPDFTWGNASYFNLNTGEKIIYEGKEIQLLSLKNQFNLLCIDSDTIWINVSRRTLPTTVGNLRIFVADNKNLKLLDRDNGVHGLLNKDALICISDKSKPLLDKNNYFFPVSFSDGFTWSCEEDSYMFSYVDQKERKAGEPPVNTGIDFDFQDTRGLKKHWIIAIENSTVKWVDNKSKGKTGNETAVLLESESQPGIYYLYRHLYNKNIEVKAGQRLEKGELIGTVWGDESWGHLTFSVIKSDSVPSSQNYNNNVVNCFPQIFELYFSEYTGFSKSFSKGIVYFGTKKSQNGNQKNISTFEPYAGKGWILGMWNITDKVEWAAKGNEGNARLWKILFKGTKAESTNPANYYDYVLNVPNGTYRIRAKMGDVLLPTWQKVSFNGVEAGEFSNEKAGFTWTSEKVVKVKDGKLTVRIFIDETNKKPAGISEIVFQKAF